MTCFFGVPGSNNELTVLDWTPLVQDYLSGESQNVSFLMATHTTIIIYKHMRYILNGRFLCNILANQAMKNSNGLPKNSRVQEKMLRNASDCFNKGGE